MPFTNTYFPFLQADCAAAFGRDKGPILYRQACERYATLLETMDDRGNPSIRMHIVRNMYPIIAYYQTLREHGYPEQEAYELTLIETQKAAMIQKEKNRAMAKMPFAYGMFRAAIRGVMKKMYPTEGWGIEWVRADGKEIELRFTRCIYQELTTRHGCPELCTVFCRNDDTTFAGYEPKIHFHRNHTLAEGGPYCDFHFLHG